MTALLPVILCGGSGRRLWPLSRRHRPKPFLRLMKKSSLLQNTAARALRVTDAGAENLVTVTHDDLAALTAEHLRQPHPLAAQRILREPQARNTAAAIALAALYVRTQFGGNATLIVMPADHVIADEAALAEAVTIALRSAQQGFLVTFGIQPAYPETGYGYMRIGADSDDGAYSVEKFTEKPDRATAKNFLRAGGYFWNSGMFVFQADAVLAQYERHAPEILSAVTQACVQGSHEHPDARIYDTIPALAFDRAILERADIVRAVPCDPGWSDIGSWRRLWPYMFTARG